MSERPHPGLIRQAARKQRREELRAAERAAHEAEDAEAG